MLMNQLRKSNTSYLIITAVCRGPWPLSLLMLSVLAGNYSTQAAQWQFQGFTIEESTPIFERTAISTAGEPKPNNQGPLATRHNT